MQGDLISRKKAIFFISDVLDMFGVDVGDKMANALIKSLETQPTVYDVEKVMEQIQKKHCKRCRNILSILGADVYCKEHKCQIEELCEIVSKGGV